jgi:hypothetical protein
VLFELLVRQITLEVLNGDKTENAKNIVKEFFASGTELNKELRLYDLLLKEKYNSESKAEMFVDTVSQAHSKLNEIKLSKEKYNLIKQINEKFELEQFLSSPITNYKVLASIYKVFESKKSENYDIKDVFNSKVTLIENIIARPSIKTNKVEDTKLIESYKKQDKDLRLLTYKILVETFNKKYTNLNEKQKALKTETDISKQEQLKEEIKQLNSKYTEDKEQQKVRDSEYVHSLIESRKDLPRPFATGGIVTSPTRALVGEAGPEAVIPLSQLMEHFNKTNMILEQILHKEGYDSNVSTSNQYCFVWSSRWWTYPRNYNVGWSIKAF